LITLTHGMVLAAGLGLRMRPLTETTAKPLLTLQGRSLLDRALDRLDSAGIEQAVVNAHWHADQVAEAVARRDSPRITLHARKSCWRPAAASPAPCPCSAAAPSPC
jgi:MurNAc alpha-1-phosphate uridylyltransferase